MNPAKTGTKAAAHYVLDVPGGGSQTVRLRLATAELTRCLRRLREDVQKPDRRRGRILRADCAAIAERRRTPGAPPGAGGHAVEQAVLLLRPGAVAARAQEPSAARIRSASGVRNTEWFHMLNADVISMPDKWEYPWYAAWDLAFHTITLALVDFDFAKEQLLLMLRSLYFHPNGQIPGLRVELQRRQSAGARLGHALAVQVRAAAGPGGPAVPGALVSGVDAELQLVGEPQGPCRAQRLRRRLSGAGQHRRLRPQRAAARPAARWSRRTAPPGWRSTASTCWRWP